jgi:hypothetical protein
VQLEGLGKLKKTQFIGTRTHDLPACSIMPQPTALPHVPGVMLEWKIEIDTSFRECEYIKSKAKQELERSYFTARYYMPVTSSIQ